MLFIYALGGGFGGGGRGGEIQVDHKKQGLVLSTEVRGHHRIGRIYE